MDPDDNENKKKKCKKGKQSPAKKDQSVKKNLPLHLLFLIRWV